MLNRIFLTKSKSSRKTLIRYHGMVANNRIYRELGQSNSSSDSSQIYNDLVRHSMQNAPRNNERRRRRHPQEVIVISSDEELDKRDQKTETTKARQVTTSMVGSAPIKTSSTSLKGSTPFKVAPIRGGSTPIITSKTTSDSDLDFEDVELNVKTNNEASDDLDDLDFEDVLPNQENLPTATEVHSNANLNSHEHPSSPQESFTISINTQKEVPETRARKFTPISKEERDRRRAIHQMYIVFMSAHCAIRNSWLNDSALAESVRRWVSPKTKLLFFDGPDTRNLISAVKTRRFLDGLKSVLQTYVQKFKVSGDGLVRKDWAELSIQQPNCERDMSVDKLRKLITERRGSRDVASQGLVALLRLIGLNARLVCALQPPDYTQISEAKKPETQVRKEPVKPNLLVARLTNRNKMVRQARTSRTAQGESPAASKLQVNADYVGIPFFWAEVWNPFLKKWVSIDCTVLQTIESCPMRRKLKFEQALKSHVYYVLAFDKWGGVKDVTRRYTVTYNLKVVKKRIGHRLEDDQYWYEKVLRAMNKRTKVRSFDVAEMKEFRDRDLAEGMPNNVQDFKNHPLYALELQLKHNEVIYPKDLSSTCGTFRLRGKADSTIPVYKRSHVYMLRSAKAWYMRGRVLNVGAQPLKVKQGKAVDGGEPEDTRLYAEFQTKMFVPQPIVDGAVPKNAFGNIDLYTPTMLPENGAYIEATGHELKVLEQAARLAGVDFARAVVAFDFSSKSRTLTRAPKVKEGGIVVHKEHEEAIRLLVDGLEEALADEQRQLWRWNLLKNWKFYLTKLRIQTRLNRQFGEVDEGSHEKSEQRRAKRRRLNKNKYDSEEEESEEEESSEEEDIYYGESDEEDKYGGSDKEDIYGGSERKEGSYYDGSDEYGGGFITNGDEHDEGDFIDESKGDSGGFILEDGYGDPPHDDDSGGFIQNEESGGFIQDEESGGFIQNDESVEPSHDESGNLPHGESGGFIQSGDLPRSEGFMSSEPRDNRLASSPLGSDDLPDSDFQLDEDGNLVYAPQNSEEVVGEKADQPEDFLGPISPQHDEQGSNLVERDSKHVFEDNSPKLNEQENDLMKRDTQHVIEVELIDSLDIEILSNDPNALQKGEDHNSMDIEIPPNDHDDPPRHEVAPTLDYTLHNSQKSSPSVSATPTNREVSHTVTGTSNLHEQPSQKGPEIALGVAVTQGYNYPIGNMSRGSSNISATKNEEESRRGDELSDDGVTLDSGEEDRIRQEEEEFGFQYELE